MLKTKVSRPGKFTGIPESTRSKVSRKRCSICGAKYGKLFFDEGKLQVWRPLEHIEHLIPRRWLEERGLPEHHPKNLLSVCQVCHGKAKVPEDRLYQGDLLGFLQAMKTTGFPVEKIVAFAVSVGLTEFAQWQI